MGAPAMLCHDVTSRDVLVCNDLRCSAFASEFRAVVHSRLPLADGGDTQVAHFCKMHERSSGLVTCVKWNPLA
jgi:hypothetical protein